MDISNIKEIYGARTPGVIGKHRFYSVLVPFCMVKGGIDYAAAAPAGSDGFDAADLSLIRIDLLTVLPDPPLVFVYILFSHGCSVIPRK